MPSVTSLVRSISHRFAIATACVLSLFTLTPNSSAQTTANVYVGAGFGANLEPGAGSTVYNSPGLGGSSLAGGLSLGAFVSRTISVGVEFSLARPFTASQSGRISGGQAQYERRHQDMMISGVLRARFGKFGGVGGFTAVRVETEETELRNLGQLTPPRIEGPFNERREYWAKGAVLGLDYHLIEWNRLAIVPHLRMYLVDQDRGDASTRFGLGSVVFRPMLTLETHFLDR